MGKPNVFGPGVITLLQWTMMADGSPYQYVWAKEWVVITNSASGIDGLKTADRFHVATYGPRGELLAIFPGCQVKAFVACSKNPSLKGGSQAYTVEPVGS